MKLIPHHNIRLTIQDRKISDLKFDLHNPRKHNVRQLAMLGASITEFGFLASVLVDANGAIVAGEARVRAAANLGMETVPTISIEHLTPEQIRAYRIADNKLAEKAQWDTVALAKEMKFLAEFDLNFNFDAIGFETAEVDVLIEDLAEPALDADDLPPIPADASPISQPGDLWILGKHRLLCGSALDGAAYETLLQDTKATAMITDPPYNVRIEGHVSGLGKVKHREFAMASGEMTGTDFTAFLKRFLALGAQNSINGALHLAFMDWRHLHHLHEAASTVYAQQLNLCVWNKSNAGMGSFYRSKHELVAVYKVGSAPHINTIELGKHGRYRSNVWDYAGVNSFGRNRDELLAMHPTVKPVALIADAIKDCTHRGDLVLDPFGGSGTTLIAAEKTGRRAALIEIDPLYVDVTIRRWEAFTGSRAHLASSGMTFADAERSRGKQPLMLSSRSASASQE